MGHKGIEKFGEISIFATKIMKANFFVVWVKMQLPLRKFLPSCTIRFDFLLFDELLLNELASFDI